MEVLVDLLGMERCGMARAVAVGIAMVVAVAAAVAGASGCSAGGPLTELVVAVDSDLDVPAELRSVRLRVVGPSGDVALDRTEDLTSADAPALPLTLSLTPGSSALEPVVITATGMVGASQVERRVETGFVQGERRLVVVHLLRACVGVDCPAGETCSVGGVCVDARVPAESLPPWTGEPAPFDAGGPTDAGVEAGGDAAGADAAGDATADAEVECMGDQDCLPDLVGPCMETCSACVEPVITCAVMGTCNRLVTSYSCVSGDCVSSQSTQSMPCNCTGLPCDDGRWCMTGTTCSAGGTCGGGTDTCGEGCVCTGSGCEEINGGGGTIVCPL
jgi:hypothetical protein